MLFLATEPDITPITNLITTWIHIGQALVGSVGALAFIFALLCAGKVRLELPPPPFRTGLLPELPGRHSASSASSPSGFADPLPASTGTDAKARWLPSDR